MQSSIKKIVLGCLFVVPFLALYVADGQTLDLLNWGTQGLYFPFITGKNIVFRVLIEIAFAGWVLLALRDPRYRIDIKKSPLVIAYGVFMLVLFLADLFAVDVHKSMWSNFERMEGFVGHIHMFAYFIVLRAMLPTLKDWQNMFKVFLAADLAVLVYAYGQLLGAPGYIFAEKLPSLATWFSTRFPIHQSENRLDATIGNSAYFAIFCLMSACIAALLWSQHEWKRKSWYPVIIALNLIALFYSGTRGTMIGLMVGVLLSLGIIAWHEKGHARKVLGGTLLAIVVGLTLLFSFKNTEFVKSAPTLNRFASISITDLTTMSRLSVWKISYEAWLERPILGYGQDNFTHIYARKFIADKMWQLESWYDRSHDVFFDWLVAAGVLGLVSYLALYVVALWLMWKAPHNMPLRERAILTGLLAGYFVHNIFVFDNLTSYILFFAFLAYIVVRTQGEAAHPGREYMNDDQWKTIWVPLVVVAMLVAQYYVNYRPFKVNTELIQGMSIGQYIQTMPFADAVKFSQDSFVRAVNMNTLGSDEAREQFLQMGMRLAQLPVQQTASPEEQQAMAQAIGGFVQAVRADIASSYAKYENDVRMLSLYGVFFNGMGDPQSGERVLTHAHTLAPKKQLISFDLIRSYLMQRKYKEAYELAKSVYDSATEYPDAQKWFLITAAYNGNFEEARTYMRSKMQAPQVDADVISSLVGTGQSQLAVKLLQEIKQQNPQYASQIDEYIKSILAGTKK